MVSTRSSKRALSPIDEPAVAPPKKAQKVTSVSKEQAQDETKHVEVILLDIGMSQVSVLQPPSLFSHDNHKVSERLADDLAQNNRRDSRSDHFRERRLGECRPPVTPFAP